MTCFTDKLIDQMKPATGDHLETETNETVLQMRGDETTTFDFNRHALNGINSPAKHSVDQFLLFVEKKEEWKWKRMRSWRIPLGLDCVCSFCASLFLFSGITPPLLLDL